MPPRSIYSCCTFRPALSSLLVAVLIVLTFVPFHVLHPVRVVRLRGLTLSLIAVWAVLVIYALANDFNAGPIVTIALCAIAALYRRKRRGDPAAEVAEAHDRIWTSPETWAALLTLTALEIVLGIDNVIFLSVMVSRIPQAQARRARQIGLALALVFRILLLSLLVWLIGLTQDVFTVAYRLFLARHHPDRRRPVFDRQGDARNSRRGRGGRRGRSETASNAGAFAWVIVQIIIIDLVFSLDSIITAIGMAQDLQIMIAAVVIACFVMYVSSGPVAAFVAEHPTTKMLALAFLVLIGVALVADGFKFHIPRGYIYFAIAFSALVELFNVLAKRNRSKAGK